MKLIALTGYDQRVDKQLASEADFELHLTKSLDVNDLMEAFAVAQYR